MQKSEPLENSISGRAWLELMRVFHSREKAANALCCDVNTISNYRHRQYSNPSASLLAEMARKGCDVVWILIGDDTDGQPK